MSIPCEFPRTVRLTAARFHCLKIMVFYFYLFIYLYKYLKYNNNENKRVIPEGKAGSPTHLHHQPLV